MSVYFATAGDYLKIGYSRDPFNRVGTITRSGKRPHDLPFLTKAHLIGWVPGNQWDEGAHHARFIDRRVSGEWFRGVDLDEVRAVIWADPRGVDIQRMSAWAVFVADRYPELTRDEMAAAGIPVEARSIEDWARECAL